MPQKPLASFGPVISEQQIDEVITPESIANPSQKICGCSRSHCKKNYCPCFREKSICT